jgi:hypothetical protein
MYTHRLKHPIKRKARLMGRFYELRKELTILKWKIRRRICKAHPRSGLNSSNLHKFSFHNQRGSIFIKHIS